MAPARPWPGRRRIASAHASAGRRSGVRPGHGGRGRLGARRGTLGTLWLRGWGRIGFDVPSVPWYFSFPFYVFPHSRLALGWAAAALPVVAAGVAGVLALYRSSATWPGRVAASAGLAAVLALAVAALTSGPQEWAAPFDYAGEYPAGGRAGRPPPGRPGRRRRARRRRGGRRGGRRGRAGAAGPGRPPRDRSRPGGRPGDFR
jgi:hypothetical protein